MRTARRPVAALLAAALTLALVAAGGPTAAARPGTGATPDAPARPAAADRSAEVADLRAEAEANGTVPVVVAVAGGAAGAELAIAEAAGAGATGARRVADGVVALEADAATLERLAADPDVTSVGKDHILRIAASSPSGPPARAQAAHAAGLTGAGRNVAVIDTGVDTAHPAFAGAVVAEACFLAGVGGTCPNGQAAQVGPGAGRPCTVPGDHCRHGTHVAGIAVGRATGPLAAGVAPRAGLVSIRIFDADPATPGAVAARTSDLIAALGHVRDLHRTSPIDAVNLSVSGDPLYGGPCDAAPGGDPSILALTAAIDDLRRSGVATVTATGNGGSSTQISFPACLSGVLRVTASDGADALASFANRNADVVLTAPGVDISSAGQGGGIEVRSGTSMAAPHISGAIALLRQRYRTEDVAWLAQRLEGSGRRITDPATGRALRRVDVPAALGLTSGTDGAGVPAAGGWVVTDGGRVVPVGRARDHGGAPVLGAGERVVAGAATSSGLGYWLATDRGRVVNLGDAPFLGDVRDLPLNRPITAMAPTASGRGYWLLGADGGVFSFGDAQFHGSTGDLVLNAPVTDLAPTPSGRGYWSTARDGGVFAFGDAPFRGSTASLVLNAPVVSIAAGPRSGYWLVALDGGVFAFDVPFLGSLPGSGVAATGYRVRASALGSGYHILTTSGALHPYGRAERFADAALPPGEQAVDLLLLP